MAVDQCGENRRAAGGVSRVVRQVENRLQLFLGTSFADDVEDAGEIPRFHLPGSDERHKMLGGRGVPRRLTDERQLLRVAAEADLALIQSRLPDRLEIAGREPEGVVEILIDVAFQGFHRQLHRLRIGRLRECADRFETHPRIHIGDAQLEQLGRVDLPIAD